MNPEAYQPAPIPTAHVSLPSHLVELTEKLAANAHDHWALGRQKQGWTYGPTRDDARLTHPSLIPYEDLSESEKEFDRQTAIETLKAITALGFQIQTPTAIPPAFPASPAQLAISTSTSTAPKRLPWHPDGPREGSPLWQHLEGEHPKRILALDGGGIKGALTLGILERLEARLAARLLAAGKIARLSDFRLCQYFDLIGGTSTGAIIAAALARGATAAEVKAKYLALGMDVFRSSWHSALTKPCRLFLEGYRFDARALERHLRAFFGEQLTLGGESLQTGLCVVAKRADTRSTWPMINHPRAKYYDVNGPLILWRLIRASSAAPTFFRPQILPTGGLDSSGKKDKGAFIDGAVSMANNPSLQCFLAAVLQGFPFHWQTGADRLLIVSVGTGAAHFKLERKRVRQWNVVELAQEIPSLVMDDAQWQNQLLMQSFSKSPTNMEIDGEVGDCSGDLIGGRELFHYVRLDSPLQDKKLEALASGSKGTKWEQILAKLPPAASLRDISAAQNVNSLAAIGEAEAARSIPEDATAFARLIPERFDTVIPSEAPTS